MFDDIAEQSLFVLRAIFDTFPYDSHKVLKTFWTDIMSKDFWPKAFKLVYAPQDYMNEFNSTNSSVHLDDSIEEANITIDKDRMKVNFGEWSDPEKLDGQNTLFVWEKHIEEHGLKINYEFKLYQEERMDWLKKFIDWSFEEE